jgi:hypothetical protein
MTGYAFFEMSRILELGTKGMWDGCCVRGIQGLEARLIRSQSEWRNDEKNSRNRNTVIQHVAETFMKYKKTGNLDSFWTP